MTGTDGRSGSFIVDESAPAFGTVYELPGNCDGRQDRLVCNQVLIMNKTVGGTVDGAYRIIYCSEEQIPSCFLRLRSVRRKTA